MPTFWKQNITWNKKPKTKKVNPEDKVWTVCSAYIRLRDALRTTGETDIGRCVTCKELVQISGNDAGHYISRGRGATKYNPMNLALQCKKCNRFQQGNWIEYREFMLEFYGKEKTEELEILSKALEMKWIDWDERAAYWRILKKTLEYANRDGFLGETKQEIRTTIAEKMKSGTLEEYLQGLYSQYYEKKGKKTGNTDSAEYDPKDV